MGRDTKVIVLRTRGQDAAEYRVAEVRGPGNLFFEADYPSQDKRCFNRARVLEAFVGPAFANAEEALVEAVKESKRDDRWDDLPIELYDFSDIHFPASNRKRLQRYFRLRRMCGRRPASHATTSF